MGNAHTQESGKGKRSMDRENLYRFIGIRLANEGDGYDLTGQRRCDIEDQDRSPESDLASLRLGNPGTVAELHRCCHDMIPKIFDGFRLNMGRTMGSNLSFGHTVQVGIGTASSTDCQFKATYTGDHIQEVSGEIYPLIVGEMDARGNLTGTLMHFIAPRWRGKLTATIVDAKVQSSRIFVDYLGESYSCSCLLSNIDVAQQMGIIVASYLRQVTAHLALGVDCIYQREKIVPGGQAALISAVARYQQDYRIWSIMLSLHALELCYSQIYSESLRASVQLQANILTRQAMTRLCYHCHLPQVGLSFRGGVDTDGVISAVCEKRLEPLPILLQLSGRLNHFTSRFRFGLGVIVG